MSNISVNTITDASGGSTASINGLTPQASNMQPFNRIINGAMTIDQRNAGAAVTPASQDYTLDRFKWVLSAASKLSCGQNAGAVATPVGFKNYLGVTSLSAYTVGASEQFSLQHHIEGFDVADLNWGAASAKTVTLSFQVYSSLTGTFGGILRNSAQDRIYIFSYSIPVANTWTTISITISGDTTGTWLTTNGIGITASFSMGSGATLSGTAGSWGSTYYTSATGATSVVGTSGATFYITGVQLEAGSTASSFAHEFVGDTLQKCQRYFTKFQTDGTGFVNSTSQLRITLPLVPNMRTTPAIGVSSASHFLLEGPNGGTITSFSLDQASPRIAAINCNHASTLTAGNCLQLMCNNGSAKFELDAEL